VRHHCARIVTCLSLALTRMGGGEPMAIGWALVSLGSHAETFFAPAITGAAGAQLVAVYSRDPARAAAFAAAHGAPAAYSSLEPLLADARVDVVWFAAPNFLHAPYTIRAARARK